MGLLSALAKALKPGPFVKPPPKRYQGDAMVAVVFHNPQDLARICAGGSTVGEGSGTVVACTIGGVLHLPNPNAWGDPYAQVVAHELAHANGWPGTHPDA
jgi:hypothetical protein